MPPSCAPPHARTASLSNSTSFTHASRWSSYPILGGRRRDTHGYTDALSALLRAMGSMRMAPLALHPCVTPSFVSADVDV